MRLSARALFAAALVASLPSAGLARAEAGTGSDHLRAATDLFYSADSDGTEVVKAGIDLDLARQDEERYLGFRLEKVWFDPAASGSRSHERVYLRAAAPVGDWRVLAAIGTDGDALIGAVSLNDESPFRKEVFVERDIVETRQGLEHGIYQTFVGAALDLPADERNVFNVLLGVQTFTGKNERLHVRGSYIHVVQPELGLTAQLRGRYFRSSEPGEFDYYSPRWHAEVLPLLQLRRFHGNWELLGAGGIGIQRAASSDWRQLHYVQVRVRKTIHDAGWGVHGSFTFTNSPATTGTDEAGYNYRQFTLGLSRSF